MARLAVGLFTTCLAIPADASDLPAGFVRLVDIDPSIRQDMRYAGSANFLHRKAKGYEAPACILTGKAAEALSKAQSALKSKAMTLVVFDCYRPARAVADFVAWTRTDGPADPQWYPRVLRGDLIAKGYIGEPSTHSRGSTVDLAIAPLGGGAGPEPACGAQDTGTLDFGTGFDCFDEASEQGRADSAGAGRNRQLLIDAMKLQGFRNYRREWWHFTLVGEPFASTQFDFPISAGD